MGRAKYRGGLAPIRTAQELALLLPIPILMIIDGFAQPLFPGTGRSSPSSYVVVTLTQPKRTYPSVTGLPVYIHWKQWRDVVVPILESQTTSRWRGQIWDFGDLLTLQNNVIGPGGSVAYPEGYAVGYSAVTSESVGALYAGDPSDRARVEGRVSEYLAEMFGTVLRDATAAGY